MNASADLPTSSQDEPTVNRRWPLWVGAGVVVLVGVLVLRGCLGGKKAPKSGPRAVPVSTATAKKGDMPINLNGLGTVTALNTVTIRSRVDGQLVRIAFQEGQSVRQGELLAEIDPRPFQVQLMQAEGQRAKNEAAFRNASADLKRVRSLMAQGIVSQQQLDTQIALVDQFEAALKADQAQVESAKLNLAYSRITAPVSGRVGLRLVDAGNMVRASDANGIAVIAPVQPINVLFTVPADSIQQVMLRGRKTAKLQVEAFDRDMKTLLATGSLAAIDNQVDPATGTVKLKGLFANENLALFPNQFVQARLRLDTLRGIVIIPSTAIQRSPQGSFVYVLRPKDNTVEMRMVEIQATDGETSGLKSGLVEGEVVITVGLEKLRPGMAVTLGKGGPGKS